VRRPTNLAVLGDLDLLHELTQGSTIAGAVLAADSDFLGALSHFECFECKEKIGLDKSLWGTFVSPDLQKRQQLLLQQLPESVTAVQSMLQDSL